MTTKQILKLCDGRTITYTPQIKVKDIFDSWVREDSLIKDDIKIGSCWLCHKVRLVNHQSTCLKCQCDYANTTDQLQKANKDRCSMCGNKRKLILDSNCCNSCLKSAC